MKVLINQKVVYLSQDTFIGEILGAVILGGDHSVLETQFQMKKLKITATGVEAKDGEIGIDIKQGKLVKVLENVNPIAYSNLIVTQLSVKNQSAIVGSFDEQRRTWISG